MKHNNGNDHEGKINSIDILENKKFVLTAGTDFKIKIWNFKKILLFQFNSNDNLECVLFSSLSGDVLLAHEAKISLIRNKYINITQEDIDNAEEFY